MEEKRRETQVGVQCQIFGRAVSCQEEGQKRKSKSLRAVPMESHQDGEVDAGVIFSLAEIAKDSQGL